MSLLFYARFLKIFTPAYSINFLANNKGLKFIWNCLPFLSIATADITEQYMGVVSRINLSPQLSYTRWQLQELSARILEKRVILVNFFSRAN